MGDNKVVLPTSYRDNANHAFKLFCIGYTTLDEPSNVSYFYIYAISALHAAALLEDICGSAMIIGQMGE